MQLRELPRTLRYLRRPWDQWRVLLQGVYAVRKGSRRVSQNREPGQCENGFILREEKVWVQASLSESPPETGWGIIQQTIFDHKNQNKNTLRSGSDFDPFAFCEPSKLIFVFFSFKTFLSPKYSNTVWDLNQWDTRPCLKQTEASLNPKTKFKPSSTVEWTW